MLSETTWHQLEDIKEFVVNGLDLLSFIFVTPLLVRLVRPALGYLPNLVAGMVTFWAFMVAVCLLPLMIIGHFFTIPRGDGRFFGYL